VNPWFVLTFAGETILYITQVPYPVGGASALAGAGQGITMTTFIPDVGISIAVMVSYTVVALVLSYIFFKRRQMSA
jgi:ABC-type transport system involved in multi-copper enzyme maturation permease subunit